MEPLRRLFQRFKLYIQVTHMSELARRYFVMNGFDGSMTMLGVIVGAWITGVTEPKVIVTAGLGGSFAMGVSGFFGAYMAEKAERRRRLKALEESMLADLNDSIYNSASSFVSVYAALIDGLSPALTAVISLIPFILALTGVLIIWEAYVVSLALTLATLFSLGLFLGRTAKENIWLYGAQMVAAGLMTAAIVFLLGGL